MKTCPQCSTIYEDHVLSCLVDGQNMIGVASEPDQSDTAIPAPIAAAPSSAGPPKSAFLLLGGMLFLLFCILGFGALALISGIFAGTNSVQRPPVTATVVPAEQPKSAAPVQSVPKVVKTPDPIGIVFNTTPDGARVLENDVVICETTPCVIVHQAEDQLPRVFMVSRDGFNTYAHQVLDTKPQLVELSALKVAPKPAAPAPTKPSSPKPRRPRPRKPTGSPLKSTR